MKFKNGVPRNQFDVKDLKWWVLELGLLKKIPKNAFWKKHSRH
jgi:hypothetical protein